MNILKNNHEINAFLMSLEGRRVHICGDEVRGKVSDILQNVRKQGIVACLEYTSQFDKVNLKLDSVHMTLSHNKNPLIDDKDFWDAIHQAITNISAFCAHQIYTGFEIKTDNKTLGEKVIPLDRVGCYVPGGSAPLISTVLMTVIPAKIAGVTEIVVCTPPEKSTGEINPYILSLCKHLGVHEILLLGGAQSISALSFGLKADKGFDGFKAVQKIVGPGNIFVTEAKRQVFGMVDIDMLAGPSEIAIISDGHSNPDYIAADLLSQLEHDPNALGVYVTILESELENVKIAFESQLEAAERQGILSKSCPNVVFIYTQTIEAAVTIVNTICPEHLEVMVKDRSMVSQVQFKAGAVFWGDDTPVAVGDFYGGTNHVLPTAGRASFSSPLSVFDFVRRSQYVEFSKQEIREHSERIQTIAEKEMLPAHKKSVKIRTQ